jgi:WD40-like Beta Propeller Repeat
MGIVAAEESRIGQYDVYLPTHVQGMAHLSYPSPDGRWVLIVEMDGHHAWTPCRVVPIDGTSPGRLVGPPRAGCTFGAWSPDGRWIYLTSNAGGGNHIWRQRFPDGEPEQITSGPTEEEGFAMAPDGRSFVTAVALRSSSLWLRTSAGDRPVSIEGNAVDAKFAPDGKKLFYRIVSHLGAYPLPGEMRVADVESRRVDVLLPGLQTLDYDVSPDRCGRWPVAPTTASEPRGPAAEIRTQRGDLLPPPGRGGLVRVRRRRGRDRPATSRRTTGHDNGERFSRWAVDHRMEWRRGRWMASLPPARRSAAPVGEHAERDRMAVVRPRRRDGLPFGDRRQHVHRPSGRG